MRKEIEERLINLSQKIHLLCKQMERSFMAEHLSKQIIRSSTSAALNYGEAQGAESRADFIHKTSIILKELRETQISLKLLANSIKEKGIEDWEYCLEECGQLVAIFHKTVVTARANK